MSRFSMSAGTLVSSLVLAAIATAQPALARIEAPNALTEAQYPRAPSATGQVADAFRQVLARYGTFTMHPRYGEVWLPSQAVTPPGWRPYPECHWI
jgi:hypothetical protein